MRLQGYHITEHGLPRFLANSTEFKKVEFSGKSSLGQFPRCRGDQRVIHGWPAATGHDIIYKWGLKPLAYL